MPALTPNAVTLLESISDGCDPQESAELRELETAKCIVIDPDAIGTTPPTFSIEVTELGRRALRANR